MKLRQHRPTLIAGGLLLAVGCGLYPADDGHWYDELQADSPCYRVDLSDGLDESSTTEVFELFDCLNYHEHLSAFEPTKASLAIDSRSLDAGAIEFARAVNAIQIDIASLADASLKLLDAPDIPSDTLLDIGLELLYGTPSSEVRSSTFNHTSPAELELGLIKPLDKLIPPVAAHILDDNLHAVDWTVGLLRSEQTHDWVNFLNAAITNDNFEHWPWHFGEMIEATQNGSNDRWPQASGDSLNDLVTVILDESHPLLKRIEPELTGILSDPKTRQNLPGLVDHLYRNGHLQQLPVQVNWMTAVNVDSEPVQYLETSSLASFIRLLASTNQPMICSLDLWVTSLDVNLGNVAITFLEILADADPTVAQSSFGLLGEILGWGFSEWALEEIANSGVCPTLTPQVMSDLKAVDVLYEPEAFDVLVSFIELMGWLRDGQANQLYNFADLITDIHNSGAVAPAEELIRDTATEPLIADLITFIPVLLNPSAQGIDDSPIVFDDLVRLLLDALDPDDGLSNIEGLAQITVNSEATWTLLHRSATLLVVEEAAIREVLDLIPILISFDPELASLESIALQLENDDLVLPLFRLIEIPDISESLMRSTSSEDGKQAPRAFIGGLIIDGTVKELLNILDWLLDQTQKLTADLTEDTDEDHSN